MKKCLKILVILIIMMSLMFICLKNVEAYDFQTNLKDDWTKQGDSTVINPVRSVVSGALTIIRVVGTGVAIIMLTYVGIKYMTAAPSEKAEFKKSATAYVVGAIVLFAASNIVGIIADFATGNIN